MGKQSHTANKLTATFEDREKYLVHGSNLKLYLQLGLKVSRIHRGITFHQEDFLRPFIERCTKMRMMAPTTSEQNMWKLIANSVYGKLIEAVSKRVDVFFDRTAEDCLKHASSPLFKQAKICDEDLVLSFLRKKQIYMKQSHIVGFSVLEMSKFVMQSLYYKEIQPALGAHNVSVIMTDTDSFLLAVRGHDEFQAMKKLAHVMDFSNYPRSHPLFDDTRKKLPGFLKNEMPTVTILEAVAVKSKVYALKTEDTIIRRLKGVKPAAQKTIHFDTYHDTLLQNPTQVEVKQHTLRSRNHRNQLVLTQKIAFTSFDDKRYLLCSIHSVPYGSKWAKRGKKCIFCNYPTIHT